MNVQQTWRRLWNSLAHATITQVNDTGRVLRAQLQIGYGEIHDGKIVVQQYGFSSVPPIGSDAVVVFFGGDRSNGMVVATNDQATRPTGRKPGETSMFNHKGMNVFLSEDGITVDGKDKPLTVQASGATVIINDDGSVAVTAASGKPITISDGGTAQAVKLADGSNSTILRAQ